MMYMLGGGGGVTLVTGTLTTSKDIGYMGLLSELPGDGAASRCPSTYLSYSTISNLLPFLDVYSNCSYQNPPQSSSAWKNMMSEVPPARTERWSFTDCLPSVSDRVLLREHLLFTYIHCFGKHAPPPTHAHRMHQVRPPPVPSTYALLVVVTY